MVRFNRVIVTVILIFCFIILLINLLLSNVINTDESRYYMIEMNRAYDDICKNGYSEDVSKYRYINSISILPSDADSKEINSFYTNSNASSVIKVLEDENGFTYIKFTYNLSSENGYLKLRIIISVFLITVGIITVFILIYIKNQIIKPFNEISKIPYELSKGYLTKNLKEYKNRFFGKFVWGLDMLRETLEDHKLKQLTLLKDKKTLILSISHDIKTPLSAIKLYTKALSDNLYEDKALSENNLNDYFAEMPYMQTFQQNKSGSYFRTVPNDKCLEITEKINENTAKIEDFINDIINASKDDFLNIEVVNGEFYLKDLMQKLESLYRDKTELLKINFIINQFNNCLIYGDINRCLEAFQNIIENAIKYGDGKSIILNINREEDCCLVTVSNTGCTLNENEIIHVFDSFWRGSNVNDKKGSGLGLYICRQILTQMKGDIFIDTVDGIMNVTIVLKMI